MRSVWKCLIQNMVAACVTVSLPTIVIAQDAGPSGIVRISKPSASSAARGPVTPTSAMMTDNCSADAMGGMNGSTCPQNASGGVGCPVPDGYGSGMYGGLHGRHCRYGHGGYGDCDCNPNGRAMLEYLKCKFGYFIPTGGGGQGLPWVGHYSRVYPVNPYYHDSRDGQIWAAQGYGVPLAVPLAPVVGHTYDYSWGIPSSRLTPVSNPAY